MTPARIFLDLEFESLERWDAAGVISVGMVSDLGEFYAELADGWSREQCSDFTVETVLPLLSLARREFRAEMLPRLIAWLERHGAHGDELVFVSDAAIDFQLLRTQILPPLESGGRGRWRLRSGDRVMTLRQEIVGGLVTMLSDEFNTLRHHALADARALRQAALAVERGLDDDIGSAT